MNLDFMDSGAKYDGQSIQDVMGAVLDLFQGVASDLGLETEDPSDPAFIDYLRDALSWADVPKNMREHIVEWAKCGCPKAW